MVSWCRHVISLSLRCYSPALEPGWSSETDLSPMAAYLLGAPGRAGPVHGLGGALASPHEGNPSRCRDFRWVLSQFRKIFEGDRIIQGGTEVATPSTCSSKGGSGSVEQILFCHPLPSVCRWLFLSMSPVILFSFWGSGLLRFYGVFLKLCVTPCSSFPYAPCPNWTTLATIWKGPLFNRVHACLLPEQENMGLAKQARMYPLCLALGGKSSTLSCSGFPSCWVVNACWQRLMSFPAWEEQFLLQFQSISCPLLFFLWALGLPCLGVAHSETLIITELKLIFLLRCVVQWCDYQIPHFGRILISCLGCCEDFEA